MLVLCVYALASLAAQVAMDIEPATRGVLDYADNAVCVLFFADFLVSLAAARDRRAYFFTWGWLDLLSSIPTVDVARWGRAARVLRALRVLRGLRAAKILATLILRRRAESTFLAASLVALLLLVFCSMAVLQFETEPGSNIKTAEDALWWAFTTITTVGYGDRYPVTTEGRFVAIVLMSAGVGLFGMFSAFLAAWFLGPQEAAVDADIVRLREEIAALRKDLERLRN
jgi:voltage-gated potassium channel